MVKPIWFIPGELTQLTSQLRPSSAGTGSTSSLSSWPEGVLMDGAGTWFANELIKQVFVDNDELMSNLLVGKD